MTAAEEGVLLLCCKLGDEQAKPLTMARFRDLGLRVRAAMGGSDPLSELTSSDLQQLGFSKSDSAQIVDLLNRQALLSQYLAAGERRSIVPITRVSPAYPLRVSRHRQLSSPPALFAMGDLSLLTLPSVAVIGSRRLLPENEVFARAAGQRAAEEEFVLVSGNAIGADQTAQNACLEAGGSCIVFVADRLMDQRPHDRILYISEDGYDLPFSPARALHRNALIHMQGDRAIAAQCTYGKGGTWEGCLDNLRHNWSPLFIFDDGTAGAKALMERGATGVTQLASIAELTPSQVSLF